MGLLLTTELSCRLYSQNLYPQGGFAKRIPVLTSSTWDPNIDAKRPSAHWRRLLSSVFNRQSWPRRPNVCFGSCAPLFSGLFLSPLNLILGALALRQPPR